MQALGRGQHPVGERDHVVGAPQVRGQRHAAASGLLDGAHRLFAVRELAGGDEDVGAGFRQPDRDVAADAAPPARDERRATRQVEEVADVHAGYACRASTNQLPSSRPLRAAEPIVTCSETLRSVSIMWP